MTIDRKELEVGLSKYARDESLVPHALTFIEPLLSHIDHNFPLLSLGPVKNEEVRDVVSVATEDARITPKLISRNRHSSNILFVDEVSRGLKFADVMRSTCYYPLAKHGWKPTPLEMFSASAVAHVRSVFENHLMAMLEKAHASARREAATAAELARDTVLAVLEAFCNLTYEDQGELFRRHVRRVVLLLPRAVPLARINNKEHGTWSVLI